MSSTVNTYEQCLFAQLLEFFGQAVQWSRSLWNIGTCLALREVLEASDALRSGILGPDSVQSVISTATRLIAKDPGLCDESRQTLQHALHPPGSKSLRFEGLDYRIIEQIKDDTEEHYLERWANALADNSTRPQPERVARSIASHLMELGFSPGFLHRWWTYQLKHETHMQTLPEIVSNIATRARERPRQFDVLILFPSQLEPSTKKGFTIPRAWLDARTASIWLRNNGFSIEDIKQQGGLLLSVTERDAEAAAESAMEIVDVFAARVLVSLNKMIRSLPYAWVSGAKQPFRNNGQSRGVHVGAIHRENKVWLESEVDEIVDPAIELLAPLQSSSPSAAVAGGWAAIEALLSEPDNRSAAADRLATIVACSYPRAELTMLSYAAQAAGGDLAERLVKLRENRDRAALVAQTILAGKFPKLSKWSDLAAVDRMAAVLADPKTKLTDIETYAADALRRLYRQRNLVLHGGKISAVALRASLRTAAPLVGAGIDRVVHGRYVDRLRPLELAARARVQLGNLTRASALACLDLLSTK